MPTVAREGSYRFFFWSADCNERPHIHVEEDNRKAKFWLDPVELEQSGGFKKHKLRDMERLVTENRDYLLAQWEEWCGGQQ